jgi:hydrogenase expression/formation protein HypE
MEDGDSVLISGFIGDHGTSILLARESLEIETDLRSDCAPLTGLVDGLLSTLGPSVKFMRDPTRGGVATVLNEAALASGLDILVHETAIPTRPPVRGICEMLGLDPLYLANEGKIVAVVSRDAEEQALKALRAHPLGRDAAAIGTVERGDGRVYLRTGVGGTRSLDMMVEDQLPRIC